MPEIEYAFTVDRPKNDDFEALLDKIEKAGFVVQETDTTTSAVATIDVPVNLIQQTSDRIKRVIKNNLQNGMLKGKMVKGTADLSITYKTWTVKAGSSWELV